jgi:hypothetical protein
VFGCSIVKVVRALSRGNANEGSKKRDQMNKHVGWMSSARGLGRKKGRREEGKKRKWKGLLKRAGKMAGDEHEEEMNWARGEVESKEAPASVDCTKFRH